MKTSWKWPLSIGLAVAGVLASTLPVMASPTMSSAERPFMYSSLVGREVVATVSSGQSGSQRYFRLGLRPEQLGDDGAQEVRVDAQRRDRGRLPRRPDRGGYRDDGPPGERAIYHLGCYCAYMLDPDADADRCLGSARRRAVPLLKQAHADEGDPEEGVASFVKLLA